MFHDLLCFCFCPQRCKAVLFEIGQYGDGYQNLNEKPTNSHMSSIINVLIHSVNSKATGH